MTLRQILRDAALDREAAIRHQGGHLSGRGPTPYSNARRWLTYCQGLDRLIAQAKAHGPRKGKIDRGTL